MVTKKDPKKIIGMVHTNASPGAPHYKGNINDIVNKAVGEAIFLENAGFDAILIENMHDRPYLKRKVGPEVVALMTRVAIAIKQEVNIPVGIQILAGANREALAVAKVAGLQFIRGEGMVFGHLADEGLMESDAGELLRYRKSIDAEEVAIFSDIQKKHSSHAISQDIEITTWIDAAEFFLSDGVIVTGASTGKSVDIEQLKAAYAHCKLPLWIGSGITIDNIEALWKFADGFIIGSWIKEDGVWSNEMSKERLALLGRKIKELKQQES
ncbi:BtpA/SgcQ family protein [Puteibacter caeruleilacunae]|nr:BtpA/SgcQ family protein [Puteibacter caeruleilacunae]